MLTLIMLVTVSIIINISGSYKRIKVVAALDSGASTALNRMILEIRNAKSVDTATTTFNTNPGKLGLVTSDSSGNPTTVQFYLTNGVIRLISGNLDQGPLTPSGTRVTSLIFRSLSTTTSQAVKIEMQVEGRQGKEVKTNSYYSTVILRGSYQ